MRKCQGELFGCVRRWVASVAREYRRLGFGPPGGELAGQGGVWIDEYGDGG